jgi:hypothetical protein
LRRSQAGIHLVADGVGAEQQEQAAFQAVRHDELGIGRKRLFQRLRGTRAVFEVLVDRGVIALDGVPISRGQDESAFVGQHP